MPDYKEMHLKIFRAAEQAVNILIAAQQECETLYISSTEPEFQIIQMPSENKKDADKE